MAKPTKRRHRNPDFRHRVPGPLPAVAEIEAELTALLTPALFAPRQLERRDPRNPAAADSAAGAHSDVTGDGGPCGEFGLAALGLHCGGAARGRARRLAVGIAIAGQRTSDCQAT